MFSDPIIITVGETPPYNYHKTSKGGPGVTYYEEEDSTLNLDKQLRIIHTASGGGKTGVPTERHVVTFTIDELNTTSGKREVASIGVTMVVPTSSDTISEAQFLALRDKVVAFIGDNAVITKLRRNEG